MSCIADGAALDFMRPSDLYSLFGNALDNAMEAIKGLRDAQRRSISLIVRRRGQMVSIHAENYFDGKVNLVDGLPQTTKGDHSAHGFGTRSMRMIVESYGGTLTYLAQDDVFHLNALIPCP